MICECSHSSSLCYIPLLPNCNCLTGTQKKKKKDKMRLTCARERGDTDVGDLGKRMGGGGTNNDKKRMY